MAKIEKKPFTLLIKPVSADCNLRCEYCFYLDHMDFYPQEKTHRMSDQVLDTLIRSYLETRQEQYVFTWQGGEPSLMGTDFFKKVTDLQQKYGRPGSVIANGFQTNGTLITHELAGHLGRYNFLVGLSLDGSEELHDKYRIDRARRGSHHQVVRGMELLTKNGAAFNIVTLVSKANVNSPSRIFRYFRDLGCYFHQYIPCVEFDREGNPLPFTITGREWGQFLCRLFDIWYDEEVHRISVRNFEGVLMKLLYGRHGSCNMGRNCREYFLVEYNGDVFPCDFFVQEDLKLGNIKKDSWQRLQASKVYKKFGRRKSEWNKECSACEVLGLCGGDCLKNRFYGRPDPHRKSWLCEGWKMFYSHTVDRFKRLADAYRKKAGAR